MDVTPLTVFGDMAPILPMVIMIIGALIMPGCYLTIKKKAPVTAIAVVIMAISVVVNIWMLNSNYGGTFRGIFEYSSFSGLMILLFQIVVFMVVFVSGSSREVTSLHYGAYLALLLIAASGMMFVAEANNLIAIFVGVETVSISSYALVAMKRSDPRAAEAAVKYVVIGGMSTALAIYGISMIYGALGTMDLGALGQALGQHGYSWAFIIGMIAMIAGYGFKIAAVPFHMWAPDVYEGAATPVSVMLATGSKKMGIIVFMKVFLLMFVAARSANGLQIEAFQYIFAIIAAFSMTIGNIVAISQNNIKRMLAYSSIAQAGYILICTAVMSGYAVTGGLFHMFTHVFMKGGAFLIVGALICVGVGEKITDYNGLAKRAPLLAFSMLIFLLSLAGVPPLAGFTSKFVLFSGAIFGEGGVVTQWVWLAFVAILNSAISLYYYVRVIKAMYIEKPAREPEFGERFIIPGTFTIAIAACVVMVIVLGIYPQLILDYCQHATTVLIGG